MVTVPGTDGIHMDREGHRRLGIAVATVIESHDKE